MADKMFVTNTEKSSILLFEGRKQYKDCAFASYSVKQFDFWYADAHYGLLDYTANPVIVNESHLRELKADKLLLALDFVAEAYNEMSSHYAYAVSKGIGTEKNKEKTKLYRLSPVSAWKSPHVAYHAHMMTMFQVFSQKYYPKQEAPNSFEEFLKNFREFVEVYLSFSSVTMMGFLLSNKSNPLFTGLVIDLASERHGDDKVKERWLKDPNYDLFLDVAVRNGFLVDKNAPWRLIADINSPAMKKFLDKWHIVPAKLFESSVGDDSRYVSAKLFNVGTLKRYLVGFYNSLKPQTGSDEKISLSFEQWMELYVFIRALEKGKKPDDLSKIVYEASTIDMLFGSARASEYVEIKLSLGAP